MSAAFPYRGRTLALATMHRKEEVIAPPLRALLGAKLVVPVIDTDQLGTFSGETPRPGGALEVALRKARLGMQAAQCHLGLASEGSFGPHPGIFCLPCDTELLVFVDDERGFTLAEAVRSPDTNFFQATIDTLAAARAAARQALFPSHAVVLRPEPWGDRQVIFKGIVSEAQLAEAFAACRAAPAMGQVWLETDMRAQHNPSRRRVIAEVADKLARRLATSCPACVAPGWGRVDVEFGLPCQGCESPTELVRCELWGCVRCAHQERRPRPDGRKWAKPGECGFCNP